VCVCVFAVCVCVCVWEREREREKEREKESDLFNFTSDKLLNWKTGYIKSAGGGEGGTKSFTFRSIPEIKLDRRWLRPGSPRELGDCSLSDPWHFPSPPHLVPPQPRRRSSCSGPETIAWKIRSSDQRPCYFHEDAEQIKESWRFNLGIQEANPRSAV